MHLSLISRLVKLLVCRRTVAHENCERKRGREKEREREMNYSVSFHCFFGGELFLSDVFLNLKFLWKCEMKLHEKKLPSNQRHAKRVASFSLHATTFSFGTPLVTGEVFMHNTHRTKAERDRQKSAYRMAMAQCCLLISSLRTCTSTMQQLCIRCLHSLRSPYLLH